MDTNTAPTNDEIRAALADIDNQGDRHDAYRALVGVYSGIEGKPAGSTVRCLSCDRHRTPAVENGPMVCVVCR